jgi:CRP/FNR family cyclic AMP-dependent transcriptional regulator
MATQNLKIDVHDKDIACCLMSAVDIFYDLNEEEIEKISRVISVREVKKGRIIYMPEDTGSMIYILSDGRIQLYRLSADGRKLVLSILGPGGIFGEMSMVGGGLYQTFAEAVEDSVVCALGRDDLERLILDCPQITLRLVNVIGQRLAETESRLTGIAFKSVPARIAALLLQLAGDGRMEVNGFTHQEISEIVGTYRETTTQTLNDFRNQGLIAMGRKHIEILDMEGLSEVAEN